MKCASKFKISYLSVVNSSNTDYSLKKGILNTRSGLQDLYYLFFNKNDKVREVMVLSVLIYI